MSKPKVKVGVVGHTGRLGKPLTVILKSHPGVEIVYTESTSEGSSGDSDSADTIFLALPQNASYPYVEQFKNKKIIDLSFDHRIGYPDWVYGSPELNRDKIKDAKYIANPGCYATSINLALYPLKKVLSNIRVTSVSGASGAGENPGVPGKDDNAGVYNVGRDHNHLHEVESILGIEGLNFVPIRIETMEYGIISSITAKYSGKENLHKLCQKFYKDERFVKIIEKPAVTETRNVIDTINAKSSLSS